MNSERPLIPPSHFAAHDPFGVQALGCPAHCSLKPELRTCARHDAKFDHFVNLVATKWTAGGTPVPRKNGKVNLAGAALVSYVAMLSASLLNLAFVLLPFLALAAQEPVENVVARVAANQDRAQELRTGFVYDQSLLLRFRRGDGKLAREELRDYAVAPTASGTTKNLRRFSGKYERDGRLIAYMEPGYNYKDLDLDGELITDFAQDFANDESSRDGIANDLFPLTTKEQEKYRFTLKAREEYRGREVFRVTFQPKRKSSGEESETAWAGEILVDTREYQPVLITTRLARGIPLWVRTLLGTNIKNLGFRIAYEKFGEGIWFPISYGCEFELRAAFFYKRKIAIALNNSGFQRAEVSTRLSFEEPFTAQKVIQVPEVRPAPKP